MRSQQIIRGGIAAALAATAAVIPARAQQGGMGGAPNPAALAAQRRAAFEKELGITAAQKAKIDAVAKKYQPKITAIQTKYQKKAEPLQKQMQALQQQMMALQQQFGTEVQPLGKQMDQEVRAVLTPAQQAKLKKLEEQQRAQMGGGAPR